jgi:hypothetical protein
MQYESDDGSVREVIWNSRDGVTPFGITAKDGKTELRHVRWREDRYAPDHTPALGDRIFVDLTPDLAKAAALANAKRFWDDPQYPASQTGRWADVEAMAEDLAKGYLTPGAPHLLVVSP